MDTPDFLKDIYPHNLLYAVTIRSPCAKGNIILIHYPKLPHNYTFLTARNIPGENKLENTDMPILSSGKISYIGEPVALLLGPDKIILEELAALCEVLVNEEEKPVFSYNQKSAVTEGAPVEKPAAVRELQMGDSQVFFENSGKIATGSYNTGIQDHWYAEPEGAICWYKGENTEEEKKVSKSKKQEKVLVIKASTQWPYHVKRSVACALGIEQSAVCVEHTPLNLHMDGKLTFASQVACHAALGTFITKKPVRLIINREEDFLFSPKRAKTNIDIASVIDEQGNINASEIDITVDLGAYGVHGEEILDQVCLGSIGYYNFTNLKLNARAVKTNIPPQGPFSGFGIAHGFFAMERHVSQIADTCGQDPAQWRKAHLAVPAILPSGSSAKGIVSSEELIDAAIKMSDYSRKWASYELLRQIRKEKPSHQEKEENPRGIGIALGFQGSGLLYHGEDEGIYSVEVTLTKDGLLEIKTSVASADNDFSRIWAKVASEIMSIEPEMVHVKIFNTPDCGPSCASRNITTITRLVKKCCIAIRKQRFHSPLPITVRRSVKPQGGALLGGRFTAPQGKVLDINSFSKPSMAAAVVEVSIDLIECTPKIRGIWLGIDGGKIISKNRAKRSLTRSAVQAIGWALTENIEFKNGVVPRNLFTNYAIPSLADVPSVKVNFLSDDGEESKGIGELPFTCIPAAFLQAVSQAMDHCYKSIPLKRAEIWEIVRFRKNEPQTQGQK
jgi:CO/xanthine dehydrogenase Mo-binding subunit